jgi:lipopolysaccharide biosynthesis regulator YciM
MGAALVVVLIALGALAVGILVGRYYVPDDRLLRRAARHSRAYMRALNHHIARDHDTVIEELKRVVEENVEDSEPYFALAALFRSRGEHERAIRVHQALAVREGGSKKLRLRARYELALDFRAAGMPRRATRGMEDVLVEEPRHEGALRALCGLYEEQGRYAEGAQVWQRLAKIGDGKPTLREHHLWIAAAQRAIGTGDLDSAKRLLKDARKARADESAHFFAAAAELAAARGNPKGASTRLRQALAKAPELARFLVPGLVAAERQDLERKGTGSAQDDLDDAATSEGGPTAALAPGAAIAQLGTGAGPTPEVALAIPDLDRTAAERAAVILTTVDGELGGNPHLRLAAAELRALADPAAALTAYRALAADFPELLPARVAAARLALASADADAIAAELRALAGHGGALTWAFDGSWRCGGCGHRSGQFFWRCPQCRRWGNVRLDVGRDAQRAAPPAPRERRQVPRVSIDETTASALLGAVATEALPAPTLDHGLTDLELARAGARPSMLARVGGWIKKPFSKRGRGASSDD